ncbi:MAG: hypothetical protein QM642_10280 [Edaphocola sp.]
MSTVPTPAHYNGGPNKNRTGGLILICIGLAILLKKLPFAAHWFPSWLFHWPVILMAVGLIVGIRNQFRNVSWLVLTLMGGYFLLSDSGVFTFNLRPYLAPIVIIAIGLFVILRKNDHPATKQHKNSTTNPDSAPQGTFYNDEYVNVNALFGGVERNVFSKEFKGGTISATFGGAEVNFAQADFEGIVAIDVSVAFGSVEIVLPSNWNVRNDVSSVFAGIDDRRTVNPHFAHANKTVVLKGTVIFGSLELKSY